MIRSLTGILIGFITGATMAVATSSAWVVLMIPARIQDRLRVSSSQSLTLAMWLGLTLCALGNSAGFSLRLPVFFGCASLLLGGMFVGMIASALGEILEAAPVLMRRFRLGNASPAIRQTLLIGKALGAVIATLLYTL